MNTVIEQMSQSAPPDCQLIRCHIDGIDAVAHQQHQQHQHTQLSMQLQSGAVLR